MRPVRQWNRLPQDFMLFLSLEKALTRAGPDLVRDALQPFLLQLSCDFYDHSDTEDCETCSFLFWLWTADIILHVSEDRIRDDKIVTH